MDLTSDSFPLMLLMLLLLLLLSRRSCSCVDTMKVSSCVMNSSSLIALGEATFLDGSFAVSAEVALA
jgi:hypothetical protein